MIVNIQHCRINNDSDIIFVSPISRIMQQKKNITEGGAARYNAWDIVLRKLKKESDRVRIVELTGRYRLLRLARILLFSKGKRIFLLYPHAGIRLDRNGKPYEVLSKLFMVLLKISSLRNWIIFDISDLKYEQAIDLELSNINIRHLQYIEKQMFSWNSFYYIFASTSMKEYALQKYKIDKNRVWTCINGGDITNSKVVYSLVPTKLNLDNNKIHYVYSGTLNKGRNIEKMLSCFPDVDSIELILMGKDGEWIGKEYGYKKNIRYIGEVAQDIAHSIVACCDVGLIPYDESRLYYNIAFPTKLSFYITAGTPYLSTPTKEVCRFDNLDIGFVAEIDNWKEIIINTTKNGIDEKKKNVKNVCHSFSWEEVLKCPWLSL